VETGWPRGNPSSTDAHRLRAAAGTADPLDLICPYRFSAPLAPIAAARLARAPIRASVVRRHVARLARRHDIMIVEGAGGLLVPLTPTADLIDLVCALRFPVLVVGRTTLGGINHARLTVESLRARKVRILALLLNATVESRRSEIRRTQQRSTVRLLRERCPVPVIGPLRFDPGLHGSWATAVARVADSSAIRTVARLMLQSAR
jgi:dethiobiotin synthetase